MGQVCRGGTTGDDSATDKFTDAGEYIVGDIADIDAVEGGQTGYAVVNRQKKTTPAQTADPECHAAGHHGKEDIAPTATLQAFDEIVPLHLTEGNPQQKNCKGKGCYIFYYLIQFHSISYSRHRVAWRTRYLTAVPEQNPFRLQIYPKNGKYGIFQ